MAKKEIIQNEVLKKASELFEKIVSQHLIKEQDFEKYFIYCLSVSNFMVSKLVAIDINAE